MPISSHGGIVPFTSCLAEYGITPPVNVIRGTAGPPLSIPAAPRRNRCFALRSPPDLLPAVGSTRHPCLASPLAAIHGVQPLSSGLRFADFSGESTPVPRSGRRVAGGRASPAENRRPDSRREKAQDKIAGSWGSQGGGGEPPWHVHRRGTGIKQRCLSERNLSTSVT